MIELARPLRYYLRKKDLKVDALVKSKFPPPLAEGDEGEGEQHTSIQLLTTPTLTLPHQGGGDLDFLRRSQS